MTQDINYSNIYIADKGKTFIRKIDGVDFGNEIILGLSIDGSEDTIDNYEEKDIEQHQNLDSTYLTT